MALSKITAADLEGKGVIGQADVPGLSTADMQARVEQTAREVIIPKFNANVDEQTLVNTADAAHIANVQNPHGVTKAQVGLGNCDNTADADKPVSTAQQTALNSKASTAHAATHAVGGTDPVTPASIGAAAASHKTTHAVGGTDALSPADIGAAAAVHKAAHAIGGADALSPADIGAAAATHTHTKSQITDFPAAMTPVAHKATHAAGGTDAISPVDIGAAATSHTHTKAQITDFPASMAPTSHASTHAAGGTDAITPASIGAPGNADVIRKDNTAAYIPLTDYAPCTKKYVDDQFAQAGSVASVFGRSGTVLAQAGDYNGGQIAATGYEKPASTSAIAATDSMNGALGKLEKGLDGKAATSHTHTKSQITDFPTSMAPTSHKATHAAGGTDALAPADIGAAATSHTHTKSEITDFPTSMTPTSHASTHATGGSDALTPAEIGAATPISYSTASSDAITLVDNTIITRTGATAVTITYPTGNYICSLILTFAASGTFSVTFPAGTTYLGSVPTWAASTTYEISIRDGVAAIAEVGTGV